MADICGRVSLGGGLFGLWDAVSEHERYLYIEAMRLVFEDVVYTVPTTT
ncbi:MAG: hypothetical protein JO055_10435 [Alphaproteobacteria bacterium]|nr:hypothetical protein [Alphaproteobacteria bacterium]